MKADLERGYAVAMPIEEKIVRRKGGDGKRYSGEETVYVVGKGTLSVVGRA